MCVCHTVSLKIYILASRIRMTKVWYQYLGIKRLCDGHGQYLSTCKYVPASEKQMEELLSLRPSQSPTNLRQDLEAARIKNPLRPIRKGLSCQRLLLMQVK